MLFNSGNNFRLFNPGFVHDNSCNKGILSFYYKPNSDDRILAYINNEIVSNHTETLPEVIVDSTIFNDVLHIVVDQREYFFAPDIGLVRYTLPDSNNVLTTYNLKSYFIQ